MAKQTKKHQKNMDDDRLKDIFKEFDPELTSSFQFMTRLQKNMEAMEIVRQYHAAQKRRNQWAVVVAAVSGFAVGVVMTILFPFITGWIDSYNFSLPLPLSSTLNFDFKYLAWLLVGAGSVVTSISAYKIALTQLSSYHMQSSASQNK